MWFLPPERTQRFRQRPVLLREELLVPIRGWATWVMRLHLCAPPLLLMTSSRTSRTACGRKSKRSEANEKCGFPVHCILGHICGCLPQKANYQQPHSLSFELDSVLLFLFSYFQTGAAHAQKPGPKRGRHHSGVWGEAAGLGATDGWAETELRFTPAAGDLTEHFKYHKTYVNSKVQPMCRIWSGFYTDNRQIWKCMKSLIFHFLKSSSKVQQIRFVWFCCEGNIQAFNNPIKNVLFNIKIRFQNHLKGI